jgi:hypothetical protein
MLLAQITETAERAMREPWPPDTTDHSAQMLSVIRRNRRGLKKLLRNGADPEYVLHHPLSQRWLLRHPRLDVGLWTRGLEWRRDVMGVGEVRLHIEGDPQEALRLGTYVGTCLSPGGLCDDASVAAVLDINKRVLYARQSDGRVLARQLLAITEAEDLYCASVYPLSTPPALRQIFADYDRMLAATLAVPILTVGTYYEVENILSQDWWDDGAWDLGVSERLE